MRDRPPQPPYASDQQLTDVILSNLWDGTKYTCPVCQETKTTRHEIIPHLQQHIDDILAGKIPHRRPIPPPPTRE